MRTFRCAVFVLAFAGATAGEADLDQYLRVRAPRADELDAFLQQRARRAPVAPTGLNTALQGKGGGGGGGGGGFGDSRRRVAPRADGAARFGDAPLPPKTNNYHNNCGGVCNRPGLPGGPALPKPFGDSRRRFGDSRRRRRYIDHAEINAKAEATAKEAANKAAEAANKEAATKEANSKEAANKAAEAANKEAATKETNSKEAANKEANSKESDAKAEAAAKEQAQKERDAKAEQAAKEQAQKEADAKEAHAKAVAKAKRECGPGYYYTAPFACDPCAAGTYQGGFGQTSCKDCLKGSASGPASASCTDCTADVNFAAADRAVQCVAVRTCPANGETATPGTATTDRICTCSKGHAGAATNPSVCSPCERGDHAPSAGATGCTPCASGRHAPSRGMHECAACEVNDALDATHVGFSAGEGEAACTKHRVCTPPTATNGAGEYQTKPASPHHDRECKALNVCHEYQYISQTETATSNRECTACPYAYKATDDFSACYAYMCSHLKCKHVRHSCHGANVDQTQRIPTTLGSINGGKDLFANPATNECDGVKLFQTTVTRHDFAEYTCSAGIGHWCGMGVISGDKAKCECAPLNLKPKDADKGLGTTPDDKGWTGHSDLPEALHPDDKKPAHAQGFAGAGTPNARDRDAPVEYLGTKAEHDRSWLK